MAVSDVSDDISSEIDKQIEEFLSQKTEKQYEDFLNSAQLLNDSSTTSTASTLFTRFAVPKDDKAVLEAQKQAIPKTTQKSTDWACKIWDQWRKQNSCPYPPLPHLCSDKSTLDSWLSKFILEI